MKFEKAVLSLACTMALAGVAQAQAPGVPPDNSMVNQRNLPTADDQAKGSDTDVELTRKIRAELTKDSSLSINAKNVKIITVKGVTTLRGPVNSEKEKARIGEIAKTVTGHDVDNKIEILKK